MFKNKRKTFINLAEEIADLICSHCANLTKCSCDDERDCFALRELNEFINHLEQEHDVHG